MGTPEQNPDEPNLEYGRLLFAQPCEFIIGVANLEQLPATDLPEIAFAGRSNVGKSSLVNALTGRKTLARTSNTPGRTQQINLFTLDDRLMLADLPGYGFAKAPKKEVDRWIQNMTGYLSGRQPLRRCCLLIDARHGFKASDRDVMEMLDKAAVSYQVILTKCDKIKPTALSNLEEATLAELAKHPAAFPTLHKTSSVSSAGIAEFRAALAELALSR
ncbi:MAG: YihA family ribosome biogenesis GTP-binding protein [Rhodospirillales bacterium]|nr:YihA family ribosome biogenesis GTP-binding protein [Rhodospirillales bacterium]